MSAQDLEQRAREQRARELLAAECGRSVDEMRYDLYGVTNTRVCVRAIIAALRQQPAPVVDDAMVDAAIAAQDAHWANDDNYPARAPRSAKGDAELHDKLARGAMRAALTAALARAQGVQS